MNDVDRWQHFYKNIKDESWPPCNTIEDIFTLPKHIHLEILKNHLFGAQLERLKGKIKHIDINVPNFLYYIDHIKALIGKKNCSMNTQDVIFLYSILLSKRPKNVLEIGRFNGWSSAVICGALKDNNCGHLYSIDIKDNVSDEIKQIINDNVTFINESSKNLLSIDKIKNLKFEVFFIDGDHSYNMVLSDLSQAVKLATDKAWFLLHDVDMEKVDAAINNFLKSRRDIIDCGIYGEKIKLLYKKESI